TAWNGDWKRSNSRAERTKKPVSSVRYSVSSPGRRSPAVLVSSSAPAAVAALLPGPFSRIAPPAMDRLELRALRLEGVLHGAKELLGLGGVVGGVVAHVDVDRHEAVLGPGVDRQVRFGEQHGAGHALRLELEEALAYDRHARRLGQAQAQRAQSLRASHLLR